MKKSIKAIGILTMALAAIMLMSMGMQDDPPPWEVPAKYKNMENPVKADDESIKVGRMLYNKNCASCHGETGLGDGPKARGLDTSAGDMSAAKYQGQTDVTPSKMYRNFE